MKRRLIVCCDGTWQDLFQGYPTNVVKTAQAIVPSAEDGCEQIVYYEEGVGTRQMNSKISVVDWLTKLGGGGLGLGIDNKIQAAYRFLCLNYKEGDEIFLFGFSRGAYTVRCLAGLIYNSGLPRCKFVRKIPEAYELYRDRSRETAPKGPAAVSFRETYGERVPIKALCCWDTVASMGLPDLIPGLKLDAQFNERYAFHDTKINHTIEHAYHAVAIDENRKVFYHTPMDSDLPGQLSQVWFPGGHGSVGGGRMEERGLSDGALQWMFDNVKALHLELDANNVEYGLENGKMQYGVKPMPKASFPQAESKLGYKIRQLPKNLKIDDLHSSVKERWCDPQCHYKPENLRQACGAELDALCE
jgi:uncharacterized protein (DUF2235 family)